MASKTVHLAPDGRGRRRGKTPMAHAGYDSNSWNTHRFVTHLAGRPMRHFATEDISRRGSHEGLEARMNR